MRIQLRICSEFAESQRIGCRFTESERISSKFAESDFIMKDRCEKIVINRSQIGAFFKKRWEIFPFPIWQSD